jgi:hypothetical protein
LPDRKLADGEFTLTVIASEVKDGSGTTLEEFSQKFIVLTGDATGDGRANDLDLYRLWQAQLRPPGSQNMNDDLDGDGQVNGSDLDLVKDNYLRSVSNLSPLATSPARVNPETWIEELFGSTRRRGFPAIQSLGGWKAAVPTHDQKMRSTSQ